MYYRQPRYYGDFHCIGGGCNFTCCANWRIDWKKDEIDKVKSAPECSQELKELCERSFKYDEDIQKYVVVFGEDGRCPFLTEDNFCRIQRELGAEYLSHTCYFYPRDYLVIGSAVYRCCHMSCGEVMKKLLNDEKSMDLVNVEVREREDVTVPIMDHPDNVARYPAMKYSAEIKEFFYEIISDKKNSLETSFVLGALAAQSLSKIVAAKQYDRIPEAVKSLKAQMHNGAQLRSIENIQPNYNIKLGIVDKTLREFFSSNMIASLSDSDGIPNIDTYKRAEHLLEKEFEDRPFVLRNMALNLMLELNIPFKLEDNTFFENYSVFVMSYAFIRHNALTVMAYNDRLSDDKRINPENVISVFNAILSRRFCHSTENLNRILKRMQDFNLTSPAYLALLVK